MTLIHCPECGKEIWDKVKTCPFCGYKFKKNNFGLFLLISIVILAIALGTNNILIPLNKYNTAISMLNSNKYDKAIEVFGNLGNYKDSSQRILECKYEEAKALLQNKEYTEAIDLFSQISHYNDSSELKCETMYLLGQKYVNENLKPEDAVNILKNLNGYKDSNSLLVEAQYQLATYYLNNKKYSDSSQIFETIGNYKDSINLLNQTIYLDACSKYDQANFQNSLTLFEKVENYEKASTYISNLKLLVQLQGTWDPDSKYGRTQFVFNGWKLYTTYFIPGNLSVHENKYEVNNGTVKDDYSIYTFEMQGEQLIVTDFAKNKNIYIKISTSTIPPKENPEPNVGMTADEVLHSKWGIPQKINKTTTVNGVKEQWVYSDHGYIYLENCIVTAIQD